MRKIATVCRTGLLALSLLLIRFCRTVWRRPRLTAFSLALFTLITASYLPRIRFLFSAQDMVGEGIPSADELNSIRERYEDGTSSILFITPPEGQFSFTAAELCGIRKWYSVTRLVHQELKNTVATFDIKWPIRTSPHTVKYQNVLQLDCENNTATTNSLEHVKELLDSSPWAALKDRKNRLSLVFSFNFKDAHSSNFGSFDPRAVQPLRDTVEADLAKIIPAAKMHWVGMADYQWYVRKGFQFSSVVNTLMLLFLIFGVRFVYGTWFAGIMFSATLAVNGIWIYGSKAMVGSAYDVLASGLFLILGVSAIEDFTFLSSEQLKGASWRQAVRKLIVPSFFTSLTSMIGFLSLCTSDLAVIRRFGLWCAIGALIEWLMLFAFLPVLLDRFYKPKRWVNPAKAVGSRINGWGVLSTPRWVSRASMLVFPLALLSFSKIDVNDNPTKVFPANHPYNLGLLELKESKGWLGVASLIWDATGEHFQAVPYTPKLDEVARQLRKASSSVVAVESPNSILDWLAQPNVLTRDVLISDFKSSLQYKQLVDPSGSPRALLYLKDLSILDLQNLKAETSKLCPNQECHAGGDLIAYSDFSTFVPKTLIESMTLSLLLVALVIAALTFAFGKQRLFFHLIASSFWGPCLMIVLVALLHIPMDFMKCIIASVLVGLTGDNAVQFLFAARRCDLREGVGRRGGASIITNVLMALTALMYLASYFNPPKTFGLLLAGGLIAALIGDLWLLNGLLGPRNATAPPGQKGPSSPA
ncbi:MAG: hypothetical protein HY074_00275 [Deltaproteobacteria bacterium]|nr:hypothetical protein [Deltaproteobacteria bacterium]